MIAQALSLFAQTGVLIGDPGRPLELKKFENTFDLLAPSNLLCKNPPFKGMA